MASKAEQKQEEEAAAPPPPAMKPVIPRMSQTVTRMESYSMLDEDKITSKLRDEAEVRVMLLLSSSDAPLSSSSSTSSFSSSVSSLFHLLALLPLLHHRRSLLRHIPFLFPQARRKLSPSPSPPRR